MQVSIVQSYISAQVKQDVYEIDQSFWWSISVPNWISQLLWYS
jgi:hypothetical protein